MSKKNKFFTAKKIIICLLLLLISIPFITFFSFYNKLNVTDEDKTTYESKYEKVEGITNILLLGTDGRMNEYAYRSDCMMIATVDAKNKNVKLTSLARDTYVNIPGKGKAKLNTAYFWGKEDLLFQTIEENFNIKLDKYIKVDFDDLMNIIFLLDGVEVNVEEHELDITNQYIKESYAGCTYPNKGEMQLLTNTGTQTLNGYQAIAYTRIRYTDSAINRDARQREVLISLFNKVKTIEFSKYPQILNTISPYLSTNLSPSNIINLLFTVLSFGTDNMVIKQGQFPIIDYIHVKGGSYKNAGWVWLYDLNSTVVLQDFIYNNIDMKDNDYLKDNSNIELNY